MSLEIADNRMVRFSYTMTTEAGELIESAEDPLEYLHGVTPLMPTLAAALVGHQAGDHFLLDLPPEEAYGPRRGPGPSPVPRTAFPPDAELLPGMAFTAQGPSGQPMRLFVASLDEEQVWVDQEHPLVGQTLRFQVQVVEVREATADEIAAQTRGGCCGGGCGSHDEDGDDDHECCGGGHCGDKGNKGDDHECCGGGHCG